MSGALVWLISMLLYIALSNCFQEDQVCPRKGEDRLDWWQKTVIYQIYPRSFKDSDGDGVGDLQGIKQQLDKLQYIGIETIWLNPIYPSPNKDNGYDVSDYSGVAQELGTRSDFEQLLGEMHSRGMKLILDFVPNHSSNKHEWFEKSRLRQNPYTDYYVWQNKPLDRAGPPNNWVSLFGGSAWSWDEKREQYYLHQFMSEQPDLNVLNPLVVEELKRIVRFWLDLGVDGFRFDAVKFLVEDIVGGNEHVKDTLLQHGNYTHSPPLHEDMEHKQTSNLPQTFELLKEFKKLFDESSRGHTRLMITEVYEEDLVTLMQYYTHQGAAVSHMTFNFALVEVPGKCSQLQSLAECLHKTITTWMNALPPNAWPNWVLSNHDNSRSATRFGPFRAEAMQALLLLLPGTATVYSGDELMLQDVNVSYSQAKDEANIKSEEWYLKYGRDKARTPYPWTNSQYAGFSENRPWLPIDPNYMITNFETQSTDSDSSLQQFRHLLTLRKHPSLLVGVLKTFVDDDILIVFRLCSCSSCEADVAGIFNLGETDVRVKLEELIPNFRYARDSSSLDMTVLASNSEELSERIGKVIRSSDISLSHGKFLVLEYGQIKN